MKAAVVKGDVKKLTQLMRQDPGFNANLGRDGDRNTLLHHACLRSESSPVIPLLLAHPGIDVNRKNAHGYTPFYYACCGSPSAVREMLRDPRINVNEPDNVGCTPLWCASGEGHLEVIKWYIASGREIDLGTPGDVGKTDAIGAAKNSGKTEVVTLLERFQSDVAQTSHAMRLEIGWYDEAAARMFALVVFVSDGLLQIKDTTTTAARFFSIARRLPLELQMMLCHRIVGSAKDIIVGKDSEVAFKLVAKWIS